jgi:hypothetical protein
MNKQWDTLTSYHCSPKASLLHPCTKVPKWDADPEKQPNYYSIRTIIHWAKRLIPKATCKMKR